MPATGNGARFEGAAWDHLPHDHARSRAYRWGEDAIDVELETPHETGNERAELICGRMSCSKPSAFPAMKKEGWLIFAPFQAADK